MRKDLFRMKSEYNLGSYIKTAFRINMGIGLTMGIVTFGGLLGSYPLLGDSHSPFTTPQPVQKRTLTVTKQAPQLPEMGLSSNELLVLRDKAAQQEARIALLNNQINSLNAQIRELNRTLFAKDNALDNSKFRAMNEKIQQKNRANAKLEQKIASLEADLQEQRHKVHVNEVTIGSLSEMITLLKENKEKVYAQHLDELHQMEVLAKTERERLQHKLNEFTKDDSVWKVALKQKKDELKDKEDHFNKALEEHNLSRQELEQQISTLTSEIQLLTVQLDNEKGRQNELREEQQTWDKYSQDLALQLNALSDTHEYIHKALLTVSRNAVAIDEDHRINNLLQTYHHQKDVAEHKKTAVLIQDQHETLKTILDSTLAEKDADRKLHDELQRTIQSLQEDLEKAYQTIANLSVSDENNLIQIAQLGADREDELQAQNLYNAFREREIRNEFSGIDDKYAYEKDQRMLLQQHLIALSLLSHDREAEIAEWVKNWEKLVVKAQLERDAALLQLQAYSHNQHEVAEQLRNINNKYNELETLLVQDRNQYQNQLAEIAGELTLAQEEAAHSKVNATLEQLTGMLQKKESEDRVSALISLENADKEIVNALETERDEAFKSLAHAEERQAELLKQVDELTQKYAKLEQDYKERHATANNSEESFAQQIQELEALTLKLHDALESEKNDFARHKEEAAKQQAELSRLYEQARDKAVALEQDLNTTTTRLSQDSNEAISNLELEREQALKNLEASEARKAELHEELEIEKAKFIQHKSDVEKQHSELSRLYEEARSKAIAFEQDLNTTTQKIAQESDETITNLAIERDQAYKNLQDSEAKRNELNTQFDELTRKFNQLENDFHNTKSQHGEEISTTLRQFEQEREEALKSLSEAEAKQDHLLKQLDDLTSKYALLESQFKERDSTANASHENFITQIQGLENFTQELKQELSQERDALGKYRKEMQDNKAQLDHLAGTVANLERERDDAISKLSIAEAQQILLTEELENLSNKYDQVQKDFQSHSQNAIKSSGEFKDQLLLLEAHAKTLEDELRKEKEAASARNNDHYEVIAALEEEREAALQRAQVTDQHKEEALNSVTILRNKVIELENQLTQQAANTQNVIQQLENQLETTRAELDEVHSTMMTSQDHYSEKEQHFIEKEKTYKQQIESLEKDMNDIQKFLDDEKVRWSKLEDELRQVQPVTPQ